MTAIKTGFKARLWTVDEYRRTIKIADITLAGDRQEKVPIYARDKIANDLILDIGDRQPISSAFFPKICF